MSRREWRPFPEAREFARSLRLFSNLEWRVFVRGDLRRLKGSRPMDIPANPHVVYRKDGWKGVRDWLGPPAVKPAQPNYLDFLKARVFARSLRLASALRWVGWCRGDRPDLPPRPRNVPEDPPVVYPDAWRGWNDWLGAFSTATFRGYRGFVHARAFARALGLANFKEWRAFCIGKRPELGPLPEDIPARPEFVYCTRGWNGYGDWLGTGLIANRRHPFMDFEEASALAVSLGLKSQLEFNDWASGRRPDLPARPLNVPSDPDREYRDRGWTSWGEFLGTGAVWWGFRRCRSFRKAREFARSLHLRSRTEWEAYCCGRRSDLPRKPGDIPTSAGEFYRAIGWTSWGDFLGTGRVFAGNRPLRGFREARDLVRALSLRTATEYRAWRKGMRPDLPPFPEDLPPRPDERYAGQGWSGWFDFLGKKKGVHHFMPFSEAREIARANHFEKAADYHDWMRGRRPDLAPSPPRLPLWPPMAYAKEGWSGWCDFLGTGRVASYRRVFRGFEAARDFARALRLRFCTEWASWLRGGRPDLPARPADVPARPDVVYRDSGFSTWADFLGAAERRPR